MYDLWTGSVVFGRSVPVLMDVWRDRDRNSISGWGHNSWRKKQRNKNYFLRLRCTEHQSSGTSNSFSNTTLRNISPLPTLFSFVLIIFLCAVIFFSGSCCVRRLSSVSSPRIYINWRRKCRPLT